jgi:protein involved in polysaccharide export with SLBB domain
MLPADAPATVLDDTSAVASAKGPDTDRVVPGAGALKSTAATGTAAPAASSSALDDARLLTSAELLTIRIHGYANLSGDYRINADETVSIPVVGRLDVRGKDARSLETEIARRISSITGSEGHATVEVARYRPIVVTGMVARAGSYPWIPGLAVVHAEALAGGMFRETANDGAAVVNAKLQLERSASELKRVLAALVRLKAERAGETTLEVPEQLLWLAGPTEARELIKAQQSALNSNLAATNAQIVTLNQSLKTAEEEVKALEARARLIETQLALRRQQAKDLESLQAKGLLTRDRELDTSARLADLEERYSTTTVSIVRVKGTILTYKHELIKLQEGRKAQLDTDLITMDREAQRLEIELDAARTAQRTMKQVSGVANRQDDRPLSYTIVRHDSAGKMTRTAVDMFAEMRPGDILIVEPTR